MSEQAMALLGDFGPLGLMIWYLVWKDTRKDDARAKIDKERIESDKALAAALAALTVTIQLVVPQKADR